MSVDARFRVASDVGGTFTDSIAYDSVSRRITVSKVSTTPANRALGTAEGLRAALARQGATGADVAYVGHGMTTATNAVIQRNGARTAFLVNAGFRDLLGIGRQNRPTLFDIAVARPEPLAPRELCFTARGRIGSAGEEIEPLAEEDVRAAARAMAAAGVEAVGVLFLHSYANRAHEARARAILEAELPGVPVCASTDISLEFREYERASTTVLNAYLRPVMETYLSTLSAILRDAEAGLGLAPERPVMVMDAAGGLMSLESAREKPVHTVLSGPAGGVVAAAHVAAGAGIGDIITMDIGGTSTDISLIRNGRPEITRSAALETVPIQLPVIDINAIGAGGGSIAWIDAGGALRVGPASAEAVPGPVCYGRGGDLPTVTDANIVLGRFDAGSRLGGTMALDAEGAARVIRRDIAEPLGLTLEEAAAGILRVAHANIVRGIRVVSVERGYDPRDFALVPFGGAGPMHGSPVARELRMPRVLVPPTPGILCAMGQLISDLRHDLVETHIAPLDELGEAGAKALIDGLVTRALADLDRDGVAEDRREVEVRVDLRYAGQSFALPIDTEPAAPGWWEALPGAFNAAHLARFGHADPEVPLEVVGFSVTGIGRIEKPLLPELSEGGPIPPEAASRGTRAMYFEPDDSGGEGAWHEARVLARDGLLAGNVVTGPAAIEEVSATTILYPGDRATVLSSGDIIMEIAR
ncbi:hydantoinase/oxoprolinase family protein [Amaricoccus solimangrovi]|uniref:Hydantoinase/oxoprolinase family protein n=1 Tax=Amaricoccus solimangrovi TaxID=2589815 RepID=A0A501WHX6_9RHOB|nr:hydantoinase/oxoprolinase family protein [Amaricoccus solimangrovi]TPE48968.1 hydantoinase/oxoprolinase family protein [Amaricoccus solimangrovi]